jgi:hypothetical protein
MTEDAEFNYLLRKSILIFPTIIRLALGPTQSTTQLVLGGLFPAVKWPGDV